MILIFEGFPAMDHVEENKLNDQRPEKLFHLLKEDDLSGMVLSVDDFWHDFDEMCRDVGFTHIVH